MPEVEDFLPIFPEETEEAVLDRLLIWLNDGVLTSDPTWIDPREGGMARTLLVPAAREMALLYDRISVELPAAASPLFAWGEYLDQWALALGTERLAATFADGTVRFTAPEGTVVEAGTEVGLAETAASDVSYVTQTEATVGVGATYVDVLAQAAEAGTAGNVSANAVTSILSPPPHADATVTNQLPMTGGTDEENDEALRNRVLGIYASAPGGGNVAEYQQWVSALPGVGSVAVTPEGQGPGTVVILATAPGGDPVSDATRTAIRDYLDPVAVDQAASAAAGTTITVPSTAGFRASGIVHLGTMANERIHNYTGLSGTQFTGVTPTPTFTAGDHAWQTGRGGGRSPVGHHVVVLKGTSLNVTIAATIELLAGYTVSASTTKVNLRPAIEAALQGYVDSLTPGQEIVLRRIESVILGVEGVYDLGSTTINGSAANVRPTTTQVPSLVVPVTLTEGLIT